MSKISAALTPLWMGCPPTDHFHYDVKRAKVSGSCSKDHAQGCSIAGKCQKISRSAMSAKASYQVFYKVMCSIAMQTQRNSASSFLCFFFVINEELQSVVNEDLNGKLPAQILDTECVEGKRVLTMCQYISLMRKRIEGKEGVSEIGDIEQLEQFLNNRTK